jgi:hypothetical protein
MSALKQPGPFMFVFPQPVGPKWSTEMTREELLHVIGYLQGSAEFFKQETRKALELAA